VIRINSLSELLDYLPITGKSGGDDEIAGKNVRKKQRIYKSEKNENIKEEVLFRIYEGAGSTRYRNLK
jgi:hypothetical protein